MVLGRYPSPPRTYHFGYWSPLRVHYLSIWEARDTYYLGTWALGVRYLKLWEMFSSFEAAAVDWYPGLP